VRRRLLFVEQNTDGTVGGSYKCLLNLIKCLDREAFDCQVVFYDNNEMVAEFARHCRVSILPAPFRLEMRRYHLLRQVFNAVLLLRDLIRFCFYLKKIKPKLIHLNNSICVGYDTWAMAGKILGIPVLTHERSYYDDDIMRKLAKHSEVFESVFCVSEAIRKHCLAFGVSPGKLFTTYEGIDIDEFRSRVKRPRSDVRHEFGLTPEQPVIGIVGNIRRWKGQDVVARALASVRERIPDVHCLMIGAVGHIGASDQIYIQELEEYIKNHQLASHVTITGFRNDIPDLLNAIDVQIHASVTMEPFGIVLLEGMSLGLPIVASNAGGPTEIIEDGETGLLCAPGDADEMAECIIRLLSNRDLRARFGKAALSRVGRFDLHSYVADISNHYYALIGERSTAKDLS
jgi:glycosyltransferase involved in cell wall biosynthesis